MRRYLKDMFDAMEKVSREFDQYLEEFLETQRRTRPFLARGWRPPTDIFECEGAFVIKIAISGLDISKTEVSSEHGEIVIRGFREDRCPFRKMVFHQMEIYYGPFEIRVPVPSIYDLGEIHATYKDGFLEICVGKATTLLTQPIKVPIRGEHANP